MDDKVNIKLRTTEDLLTPDEAIETINRLRKAYRKQKAELAALRAKYEPVCPSCGLQNNRLVHNRYCDRCGTNMTIAAPEV
jgi:tRNA(Ile2) C34 agmatinyltransferase TiaS